MEFLIIIGVIWAIFAAIRHFSKNKRSNTQVTRQRYTSAPRSVSVKRDPSVYRPKAASKTIKGVRFISESSSGSTVDLDIADLVDALTGAPLQASLGLYQCRNCRVFYQSHSVEVINSENAGRCVSCLQPAIESIGTKRETRGRNADVNVVTLDNYRQHTGRVITFEGYVHKVLVSRRGVDYAVMFEATSWTKGFKMVVFRGDVGRIGGRDFLFSLAKRKVRIRGLLIQHKRFGYEIIISDRAMILSVQ